MAGSASGFLNLHKPAGVNSHACVDAVRKIFRTRRVGHGGTLDPMATGVLVVAVGSATRFLQVRLRLRRRRLRWGSTLTSWCGSRSTWKITKPMKDASALVSQRRRMMSQGEWKCTIICKRCATLTFIAAVLLPGTS